MRTVRLALLVIVLLSLWPQHTYALPQDCADLMSDGVGHHVAGAILEQTLDMAAAGRVEMWTSRLTGTMLIAWRVQECGGQWLLAVFKRGYPGPYIQRKGQDYGFVTHFFPSRGRAYIMAEVAKLSATALRNWRAVVNWTGNVTTIVLYVIIPDCDPVRPWLQPCEPMEQVQ